MARVWSTASGLLIGGAQPRCHGPKPSPGFSAPGDASPHATWPMQLLAASPSVSGFKSGERPSLDSKSVGTGLYHGPSRDRGTTATPSGRR